MALFAQNLPVRPGVAWLVLCRLAWLVLCRLAGLVRASVVVGWV